MLFLRKKSESQNVNKKGGGGENLCLLEKFSLLKIEYLFSALSFCF